MRWRKPVAIGQDRCKTLGARDSSVAQVAKQRATCAAPVLGYVAQFSMMPLAAFAQELAALARAFRIPLAHSTLPLGDICKLLDGRRFHHRPASAP